jgi:hypothetical protein
MECSKFSPNKQPYKLWCSFEQDNLERTLKQEGNQNMCKCLNLEDKSKITIVVSFDVVGNLLPPWIIFIGTTSIIFPPKNQGKRNYIKMFGTSPLVKTIGHP